MSPPRNYLRQHRLLTKQAFDRVFGSPSSSLRKQPFLLLCADGEQEYARLGALAPKKYLPRAVDRNRIKRICREQFRLMHAELPPTDIVVLCKRFDKFSRSQLRNRLRGLFRCLIIRQQQAVSGTSQSGQPGA